MFLLRSIRFRLTFWYALTLVVILTASALFSFHFFSNTLNSQVDAKIMAVAEAVARLHRGHLDNLGHAQGCEELKQYGHEHNWDDFIVVRGANLQPLCTSDNLIGGHLEFGAVAMQQTRRLSPHLETIEAGNGTTLRLLSYPIDFDGRLAGVVQVAKDLGPVHQTIRELRLVYSLISPFTMFWLCLGCWFLADRLVTPIVEITNAARDINADRLGRRLPYTGYRDELGQMVIAFNQMLERLESAFRRVRQFSGDASHELRTPLTILRGETEVTLRWAKNMDEFRDMLRSNLEEIDRMERIIENLLVLAKSESNELALTLSNFSLSDLIQALYMQAQTLGETKQITVQLRVEVEDEVRIYGDELRLRQLFLNIISNAIKYTPEGGSVEVVLSREGTLARVDVTDTGIGIPEESLPFIFDRFYRVDKARNRMDGGSGLGLSIVKSIAEAHGGQVSVQSRFGQGSIFSVQLPVAGPDTPRPHPAIRS